MKTALNDILVIELGTVLTAPLAGMMLADMGARVIKVEHPDGGDPFRRHAGKLYSPHFAAYNRNKESIQLDLQTDQGKADLAKLISRADVLLDNYRSGVMQRLSFDEARLKALNPRLIQCSITGFGASGPYRDRPCYDAVAVALSGIAAQIVNPEQPALSGPSLSDNITGMYAAYGILGALHNRDRTGEGARVEVNMLEASVAFSPEGFAQYTGLGLVPNPLSRVAISQSYVFRCADGRLVSVHLSSVEKFWQGFVKAIERDHLLTDPRFQTPVSRTRHYLELAAIAGETFAARNRDEWCRRLEANDVPFAAVNSAPEVMQDPQVRHLGIFYEVPHPEQGRVTAIHRPVLIDGERGPSDKAAPTLGEHTAAIRREFELS
ncbi:CaiB/BaiF CoA transferase family protein [Bordetella avium]|uniref:CoA-transferase n=1 Tax=Bordetella avium (strain 197N) TaxID=360910 RepID=Q2KXS1_BORA1|nr:CoA transferase [Bordetella avium]AZY48167.1 CoA transferase [Bordetella avium]AZY51547.1 CoA transferase [Bordetella avium]RIQ16709.1 CoA transferase [Bordetella avium]RIQ35043.1 CoA transferase [Bordetella avium]RIQ49390.1 CoA transferase [Bordetella avium]